MSVTESCPDTPGETKLLKVTSVLMGARIFGTGVGFLIQLFLVRLMTPAQYGIYVVALACAGVLSILCTCGFPSVAARFVLLYRETGQVGLIAGFVRSAQLHIFLASTFICLAMGGIFWGGIDVVPTAYRLPLFVGCLIAPLLAFMRLNGAFSNTSRRFYLTYFPDLLVRPILLVIGLAGTLVFVSQLTAVPVLLAHLVAAAFVSLLVAIMVQPVRHFEATESAPSFDVKTWQTAAIPMMFVVLLTAFLADLDMLVLSLLLPPEDIAVFSICIRMMLLVEFGLQSVFQIVTPDLAEAHACKDRGAVMAAIGRAQFLNMLFTGAALLGVLLLGGTILSLFGDTFVEGKSVLVLLVFTQLVRAIFGPVTQILTVAGEQVHSLLVYVTVFLVLLGGNFALVPSLGVDGAALVFCIAVIIGTALQARAVSAKLGYSVLSGIRNISVPGLLIFRL